ncbi:MAG: hypothetical protein O7C59_08200 [Rickettsia endosymbiont of Ixodes persulcatus]|nr:hypothetical protein [Rickettsia endosymbiont of Ixodes persulcatus]
MGVGDCLDVADAGYAEHGFGDLVDDEEIGGVPQIVVVFDEQQLRIHFGDGEVSLGCSESGVCG